MATAKTAENKDVVFEWEGKDRNGKQVRGEMRAAGENQVKASLRRQGVTPTKIKKRRMSAGKSIKPKDMAIFTREPAGDEAAQRHPHGCGNRYVAERGVQKVPAVL
jgi:type IV pilus assembly protein PilC